MAFITLDFETPFAYKPGKDNPLRGYTLKSMSYEQYIRDERFRIFGVGVKINDEPAEYFPDTQANEFIHDTFLPGNDHTLIAHNALFDGAIFSWHYGRTAARYWCTQAMSRALWNQADHSLDALTQRCYPNGEYRKTHELASFANLQTLTFEQQATLGQYCLNDVNCTFANLQVMWPLLPDDELELIDITLKMHIHPAFHLNRELVQQHIDELSADKQRIIEASGLSATLLRSPTQFPQYLIEQLGITPLKIPSPTPKNPNNTRYALGKDDLEFLDLRADYPEHEPIWQARIAASSTQALTRAARFLGHSQVSRINPKGRLPVALNYAAAHTLRWGGTNATNMQNLGRGSPLRYALEAPPGYNVIVADQSNIETRMLAWFADEESMLSVFANKGDLYNDFASVVYNRPIDRKAKAQDGAGNYLDKHGNIVEDPQDAHLVMHKEGFVGKTCILGLGYGTGPAKLKRTLFVQSNGEVNFSLETCQQIVYNDYRGTYTAITTTWLDAQEMIGKMLTLDPGATIPWRCLQVERGRIRLPNNTYLNYPGLRTNEDAQGRIQFEYWNGEFYTNLYGGKLIENIIQALSRVTIANNILNINRFLVSNQDRFGSEARVIHTVHDEIIALGAEEHAEEIYHHMLATMRKPPDWCADGSLVLDAEGGFARNYPK